MIGAVLLTAAQGIPERTLPAATVEFSEGFTRIGDIRELGDGRFHPAGRYRVAACAMPLVEMCGSPGGNRDGAARSPDPPGTRPILTGSIAGLPMVRCCSERESQPDPLP